MLIIRATLRDPTSLQPEDAADLSTPYGLHQRVWRLFSDGPERRRDFLYRLDHGPMGPTLMAVSARTPNFDPVWAAEVKDYNPRLVSGERLRFILRANPTIARKDGTGDRGQRHDVVMDLKRRMREEGRPDQSIPESILVQEACATWLARKGPSSGFEVRPNDVIASGFRTLRFDKPGRGQRLHISSVDLTGILTVTDAPKLAEGLFRGIGPAKSFGLGLMMVRRP